MQAARQARTAASPGVWPMPRASRSALLGAVPARSAAWASVLMSARPGWPPGAGASFQARAAPRIVASSPLRPAGDAAWPLWMSWMQAVRQARYRVLRRLRDELEGQLE